MEKKLEQLRVAVMELLKTVNAKQRMQIVDVSSDPSVVGNRIDEIPSLVNLTSGTYTIPDGLISYSIHNYGESDITVDGVIIPSGIIIDDQQLLAIGNLIGCEVDALSSACLIFMKQKG